MVYGQVEAFFESQELHEIVGDMGEASAGSSYPVPFIIPDDPPYSSPTWVSKARPTNVKLAGAREGLSSISSKKDMMLVFLTIVTRMRRGIDIQASSGKSMISWKAVMAHEPNEGLDLIRNSKLPDPIVEMLDSVGMSFETVNMVIYRLIGKGIMDRRQLTLKGKQPESPSVQCLSVANDQIQQPESPSEQCLSVDNNQTLDTANGTESSNKCNTTSSFLPTDKKILLGIRRQKNGRYGDVITNKGNLLGIRRQKNERYGVVIIDKIRNKQIWLGTFNTVEEASQAYFYKKFEFEKLSQQGNKENKAKENLDQIQQPELPIIQCLSVAIDPTLDTTSVTRINFHEKTDFLKVHKNSMSGKENESSKETPCLMASVHGTKSSVECNASTNCSPKGKINLIRV
ncbi:hypothetical protein CQW23_01412 [Capsicum baccatum]|uniref:AP2/ERF domain-containing protein n=1 Tax=Capsicum baccatum TaxID=33114 RepID=A0A2G2XNM0_CAPBA|nr:hypothetical protein CQW23_01412 [Capsicum baccatum]